MIDYEALATAAIIFMAAVSLAAALSIALEERRRSRWAKAHPFEDAIRLANSHRDDLEARRAALPRRGGAR